MFGFFGLGNKVQGFRQPQQTQGIAPQFGAAIQHPMTPVGSHAMRSVQQGYPWQTPNPALAGPQGSHAFSPQGQQFANQQALAAQQAAQAAEHKRLADALRAQQEAEAQAQQQPDNGFYTG